MPNPQSTETSHWELAFEHYQFDRVQEAHELISESGIGETAHFLKHYRMIEAEAVTRSKSKTQKITEWLSLEYIPKEVGGFGALLPSSILLACDQLAARLGWLHTAQTLLTILAEESDAEWASFPQGYCVSKDPYEKICLPNYLLDDQAEFARAVAHEYAHVISSDLSEGLAPRWLEETISVLAEGSYDEPIRDDFRRDPSLWLTPTELEMVNDSRSGDGENLESVLRAYQQSGWIGRYLCSIAPEVRLRELLIEHTNEGILKNLKLQALGLGRVDGALRAVYRLSTKQVFDNALEFVRRF